MNTFNIRDPLLSKQDFEGRLSFRLDSSPHDVTTPPPGKIKRTTNVHLQDYRFMFLNRLLRLVGQSFENLKQKAMFSISRKSFPRRHFVATWRRLKRNLAASSTRPATRTCDINRIQGHERYAIVDASRAEQHAGISLLFRTFLPD